MKLGACICPNDPIEKCLEQVKGGDLKGSLTALKAYFRLQEGCNLSRHPPFKVALRGSPPTVNNRRRNGGGSPLER